MRDFGLILTTLLVLLIGYGRVLAVEEHHQEPVVQAEQQEDKLHMYRRYSGSWVSTTRGKATDLIDEPYESKGHWTQRDTLNGGMIEMRGADGPDGEKFEYMWLYTYDLREEKYVAWFHDERGVNSKMHGDWSEEKKQMTWTLADPEAWPIRVTIVEDLSDPDRVRFTFKMVGEDGTLVSDEQGVAERKPEQQAGR